MVGRPLSEVLFPPASVTIKISGARSQGGLDRALRHQHVLPESAERAPVPGRIEIPPDAGLIGRVFARSRAGRENHGILKFVDIRNAQLFLPAVRAFPAVGLPARSQARRTGHRRHDLPGVLHSEQRSEGRNPP